MRIKSKHILGCPNCGNIAVNVTYIRSKKRLLEYLKCSICSYIEKTFITHQ